MKEKFKSDFHEKVSELGCEINGWRRMFSCVDYVIQDIMRCSDHNKTGFTSCERRPRGTQKGRLLLVPAPVQPRTLEGFGGKEILMRCVFLSAKGMFFPEPRGT